MFSLARSRLVEHTSTWLSLSLLKYIKKTSDHMKTEKGQDKNHTSIYGLITLRTLDFPGADDF